VSVKESLQTCWLDESLLRPLQAHINLNNELANSVDVLNYKELVNSVDISPNAQNLLSILYSRHEMIQIFTSKLLKKSSSSSFAG
jgi:hypothetical protein